MKEKKSNNLSKLSKTTRKINKPNSSVAINSRKLIDSESGEIINTLEIETKSNDINFDKIFLGHIIEAMEMIGNKKIKLLMYLFSIKNSDNQIIKTQRDIAKESEISLATVSSTMKALQDNDFIVKKSSSVYVINPNMIFKGSGDKRMNILLSYQETKEEKETKISENPDTFLLEKKDDENE